MTCGDMCYCQQTLMYQVCKQILFTFSTDYLKTITTMDNARPYWLPSHVNIDT